MLILHFLLIASSFGLNLQTLQKSRFNYALCGSHHLGRYGNFLDSLSRPRNKPMEELQKKLNIKDDKEVKSGADLRKNRERNLRTYTENNPYDVIKIPEKPFSFSPETIKSIVETLNNSIQGQGPDTSRLADRIGLINWTDFSLLAENDIPGFAGSPSFQKNLISWTRYHIRKGDIVRKGSMWTWDSTRLNRYGRFRRTIVPRNKEPSRI